MITIESLKFFEKNSETEDILFRYGAQLDKNATKDWKLIIDLIQDIYLIRHGLVSETFKRNVEVKIRENCENKETVEYLYNMSKSNLK